MRGLRLVEPGVRPVDLIVTRIGDRREQRRRRPFPDPQAPPDETTPERSPSPETEPNAPHEGDPERRIDIHVRGHFLPSGYVPTPDATLLPSA